MVNTRNFRQVGRRTSPEKKAPHVRKKTMPSIPSKYAYTQSERKVENKAFGCSSSRFRSEKFRAMEPGPGQYKSRISMDTKSNNSYSKRGYGGGFASKTERFPQRPVSPKEKKTHNNSITKEKEQKLKTYADTSFNCSSKRFHKSSESADMPGPGTYFRNNRSKRGARRPTSSFRSESLRGQDRKQSAPAPGQYTIKKMSRHDAKLPSSMFRSSTERLKSDLKLMQGPGPGTYEGHVVHTSFGSKHERPRRKRPMKLAAAHFHKHRTISETPVVDMPSCLKKKKNSGEKLKSPTETTEMSAEKKKKSITTTKREQTRPKVYVTFGHVVRLRSARKQMAYHSPNTGTDQKIPGRVTTK